jgi:hypothetical protein
MSIRFLGGRKRPPARANKRSENYLLKSTFSSVNLGGAMEHEECPECGGSGQIKWIEVEPDYVEGGPGRPFMRSDTCSTCGGSGFPCLDTFGKLVKCTCASAEQAAKG